MPFVNDYLRYICLMRISRPIFRVQQCPNTVDGMPRDKEAASHRTVEIESSARERVFVTPRWNETTPPMMETELSPGERALVNIRVDKSQLPWEPVSVINRSNVAVEVRPDPNNWPTKTCCSPQRAEFQAIE